jgi:hypothetical protein
VRESSTSRCCATIYPHATDISLHGIYSNLKWLFPNNTQHQSTSLIPTSVLAEKCFLPLKGGLSTSLQSISSIMQHKTFSMTGIQIVFINCRHYAIILHRNTSSPAPGYVQKVCKDVQKPLLHSTTTPQWRVLESTGLRNLKGVTGGWKKTTQ